MEFDNYSPLSAIPHYLQPQSRSVRLLRNTRTMATSNPRVPHSQSSAGSIGNRLARLEHQAEREKELTGFYHTIDNAKVIDKVDGFEEMVDAKIHELSAAMDVKLNSLEVAMDVKLSDFEVAMGVKLNNLDAKLDKIIELLQNNKPT